MSAGTECHGSLLVPGKRKIAFVAICGISPGGRFFQTIVNLLGQVPSSTGEGGSALRQAPLSARATLGDRRDILYNISIRSRHFVHYQQTVATFCTDGRDIFVRSSSDGRDISYARVRRSRHFVRSKSQQIHTVSYVRQSPHTLI